MKRLFTILLIAAGSLSAFSQNKGDYEVGVNIGGNVSSANYPEHYDYKKPDYASRHPNISRLNITAFGDYFLSNRWSIKAKLAYNQKGWDYYFQPNDNKSIFSNYHINYLTESAMDNDRGIYSRYKLNYITMPVMISFHFGRRRNWYINYGPYIGFLLGSKHASFSNDLNNYPKTLDIGSTFGFGLKIPIVKRVKLFLEFETQNGFRDILKTPDGIFKNNSITSYNFGVVVRI